MMEGSEGMLLKVNPPLRPLPMPSMMLQRLADGDIDWIETDHAPHTRRDERIRFRVPRLASLQKAHRTGVQRQGGLLSWSLLPSATGEARKRSTRDSLGVLTSADTLPDGVNDDPGPSFKPASHRLVRKGDILDTPLEALQVDCTRACSFIKDKASVEFFLLTVPVRHNEVE